MPYLRRDNLAVLGLVLLVVSLIGSARAADWPQVRLDARRSAAATESLPAELLLQWKYQPRHAPRPAWSGRDTRMPFDRVYHTVIADGTVFFGSSADDKVYALDAASGEQRWTFFTGGPVRFAPALWRGRVFVVSDDGVLYCLAAEDGRVLWQLRGGPADSMVLGNERMISRWPARGGPVVVDDTVYFAAGIWPSEGIHVYAVDAATGTVRWVNDTSGGLVMEQPHGGNRAASGISAQGYLAADGERLFVPVGRGVPAVLDRADGKLLYFRLAENTSSGGADVVVVDDLFLNAGRAYDTLAGDHRHTFTGPGQCLPVAYREGFITWRAGGVCAFQQAEEDRTDKKGNPIQVTVLQQLWSIPAPYGGTSLVAAGETFVSAGPGAKGHGVAVVDIAAKTSTWSAAVDGDPFGLAIAGERLYVSTDKGTIYCYGQDDNAVARVVEASQDDSPYVGNTVYAEAADEIIRRTGVLEGYCLDLACGDGALAYALAQRTKLHIIALDSDAQNVAAARRKLDAAGLYGVRVTVQQGDQTATAYPDYFADLIVSGRSVTAGADAVDTTALQRLSRPYGGITCIGKPSAMRKNVRGALDGAGSWTHQYADTAGTSCATDRLAKGPLGALWYTDLGFAMPSRHGRGPAPLCKNGIMVIQGLEGLLAVDVYNGRRLWKFPLPGILKPYDQEHLLGTAGTHSNMCLAGDSVYVRVDGRCLRIDLSTGRQEQEYAMPAPAAGAPAPGEAGVWGFIACDGDTLFGSRANEQHVVKHLYIASSMERLLTESDELFALDVESGKKRWSYQARRSIRHNAIAIGGGKVYLIDRDRAVQDLVDSRRTEAASQSADPPTGTLLCLDATTGNVLWEDDKDIYGTTLISSTEHDVLVMGYQYSQRSFQLPSETGNRLTGFRAADGTRLWDAADAYISRPLINDRTVYTQPIARDLLTGQRDETFQLTGRGPGGCGTISGSTNLLLYRSGTLGYTDLSNNQGTENYGGVRPGCWINAVVAGGLVLMPDASDRCSCSYLIKASIALQPYARP